MALDFIVYKSHKFVAFLIPPSPTTMRNQCMCLNLVSISWFFFQDLNRRLKFVFARRVINFKAQNFSCSPAYYRVTIHHYIFLKPVSVAFPYRIVHQFFIIHFFMNDLLLPRFIQARQRDRTIYTKNNLLASCHGVFGNFLKLFFCFHIASTGYIQFLCFF